MIDNNQTSNATLTFDQLQAIDVAQKRLSNLESEIVNAAKVLKGTKMECDRAVKEKTYQEELLGTLTIQTVEAKKQLDETKTSLLDVSYKLDDLNKELKTKTTEQTKKDTELTTREDKISSQEIKLNEDRIELDKRINVLLVDSDRFNSKVAKLKEVIASF